MREEVVGLSKGGYITSSDLKRCIAGEELENLTTSRKDRRSTHLGRENSARLVNASSDRLFRGTQRKLLVVLPRVS